MTDLMLIETELCNIYDRLPPDSAEAWVEWGRNTAARSANTHKLIPCSNLANVDEMRFTALYTLVASPIDLLSFNLTLS